MFKGEIFMMKKSAFTLAEVLITLAIIGVVAAMTIPSLMNQTGDQEYKVGAKKALSMLAQAATMNYAVDGFDYSSASATAKAHDGKGNEVSGTGLPAMYTARLNVAKTSAPTGHSWGTGASALANTYVLADGMVITFPATCEKASKSTGCTIYVDVNGVKGPNTLNTDTTADANTVRDQFAITLWNQTAAITSDKVAAIVTK